jgi:hypothetical protein
VKITALNRQLSIGECSSNSPFLKNNGAEAPKAPKPIVFKEWRDTRTCDVNLLSKLSIIFKEWRVMNNVDRGEVIVLFVL